jgi:hypothetical protein
MFNPILLVQGLQVWVFRTSLIDISRYGPAYLVYALVLVAGCAGLLMLRYRRVAA